MRRRLLASVVALLALLGLQRDVELPAPVVQQSKGLQGCRSNPFPTQAEIARRTPGRAMAYLWAHSYSPEVE